MEGSQLHVLVAGEVPAHPFSQGCPSARYLTPKCLHCGDLTTHIGAYPAFFKSRYRLQTVRSLAGVSLMLRLLWACLRWDDMAVKPSALVAMTRKGEETGSKLAL